MKLPRGSRPRVGEMSYGVVIIKTFPITRQVVLEKVTGHFLLFIQFLKSSETFRDLFFPN